MTDIFQAPVVKVQMLIRKPVAQVFEALVDPAITSRFWFSKGSGRLEAGNRVGGTGRCTVPPARST